MRAVGMTRIGEPSILEMPAAKTPGPDEVRVAVELVAISIAEVRAVRGDRFRHFGVTIDPATPFVFGFAGVGRIADSGTADLRPGQRVVLSGLDTCGHCPSCRAGWENHCPNMKLAGIDVGSPGFAQERITLPARRVFPLPAGFRLEFACVVSEVATAIHALQQGRLERGEGFAVVGAGRHGRQLIRVAKRWGATPVVAVDPNAAARERALSAGADLALAPFEAPDRKLEVVVHANSDEGSLALCCDLSAKQGRIVLLGTPTGLDVGLPKFLDRVVIAERELIASDSKNSSEYRAAIALMHTGEEDWDIRNPQRMPMAEAHLALRRAAAEWPIPEDQFIEIR